MKEQEKQLDMYDAIHPYPPMWECTETCRHFGEEVDSPSWWFGQKRCLLPKGMADMDQTIFDNIVFIYCKHYEKK